MKMVVLFIFALLLSNSANATSGWLRKGSIVTCGGVSYGRHGSDGHWHRAQENSDGRWSAVGDVLSGNPCASAQPTAQSQPAVQQPATTAEPATPTTPTPSTTSSDSATTATTPASSEASDEDLDTDNSEPDEAEADITLGQMAGTISNDTNEAEQEPTAISYLAGIAGLGAIGYGAYLWQKSRQGPRK